MPRAGGQQPEEAALAAAVGPRDRVDLPRLRKEGQGVFSPTAETFGVSAQIGSGVVRGGPEVRFHKGSTRVPPGFHQVRGFHQGSANFFKSCGVVRGGLRKVPGCGVVWGGLRNEPGSTRVPPAVTRGGPGWFEVRFDERKAGRP